jgi:hypothetical protein
MRGIGRETGLTVVATAEGFRVTAVRPGSAADRSGLEPGDVIVRVHSVPTRGVWGRVLQDHLGGECLAHVRDARTGEVVARWVDFGDPGVSSAAADGAPSVR